MTAKIEVRIAGRGSVRDGVKKEDAKTSANCDLCGEAADATVSVTKEAAGPFACKECLRSRLEAITVASWELRRERAGLPWGKVSG